jgi:hypothetical protein
MTFKEQLDDLSRENLPYPFGDLYSRVHQISTEMSDAARKLGLTKTFTPDGRMKGDLGEVIGFAAYKIQLHPTLAGGEDGVCEETKMSIEVKLRTTSSEIWVKLNNEGRLPDILLLIWFNELTLKWCEVYNGPSEILRQSKFASYDATQKRYTTTVRKLFLATQVAKGEKVNERARAKRRSLV